MLPYYSRLRLVAIEYIPQSLLYYISTAGYKSHRLLRTLNIGAEVAIISGIHCIKLCFLKC